MNNTLRKYQIYTDLSKISKLWQGYLFRNETMDKLDDICNFVESRINSGAVIYPANPFRVLYKTEDFSNINVVILGQDPYHNKNQADGLAFSVPSNCKTPPSLKNIQKEIINEFTNNKIKIMNDLSFWEQQGVFLLNTIMTVEHGKPMSHAKHGWETITDLIIKLIADDVSPKVFILWGANAQKKMNLINNSNHLILKSNHPSPLSANKKPIPFIGCNHFIKTNEWLFLNKKKPIEWFIQQK